MRVPAPGPIVAAAVLWLAVLAQGATAQAARPHATHPTRGSAAQEAPGLSGGPGADRLAAGPGGARLEGHQGDDRLIGGAGDDDLHGGQGRDTLEGGAGADRLDGERGDDLLSGGPGPDRFVLDRGGGQDRATDFDAAAGDRVFVAAPEEPTVESEPDGAIARLADGSSLSVRGVTAAALQEALELTIPVRAKARPAPLATFVALAPLILAAGLYGLALRTSASAETPAGRPRGERLSLQSPACRAALLFLVVAGGTAMWMAWRLPPFMAADEPVHVARAEMQSRAGLVGERITAGTTLSSGGRIDTAVFDAATPFGPIMFHPERKVTPQLLAAAGAVPWRGRAELTAFSGAAGYPPVFYGPVTLGVALGKLAGLPVVGTLHLARALNVVACILIGATAIALAGRAWLPLYAILSLPMSLALYSGATQDGPALAVAALAVALISRAARAGRAMTRGEILAAAGCIALLGMAKPPYALLGLILPVCAVERPRWRWAATAIALAVPLAWALFTAAVVATPLLRADAVLDPAGQVLFLLKHPLAIGDIAAHTLTPDAPYATMFVGVLGWLDTYLPPAYYPAAEAVLGLAFLAQFGGQPAASWRGLRLAAPFCALAAAAAVFAALYVLWNPVGVRTLDGVQGRYLLPIALFLALVVEGAPPERKGGSALAIGRVAQGLRGLVVLGVVLFPLVSAAAVRDAILLRYYGL
jgi:hypothetical protein